MDRKVWELLDGMTDEHLIRTAEMSMRDAKALEKLACFNVALDARKMAANVHTYAHHKRPHLLPQICAVL